VPNAIDFAKTADARILIEAGIHAPSAILRACALPPGTPKGRADLLRAGFNAALKDLELLAEMKKSKLEINPLTAAEWMELSKNYFKPMPRASPKSATCWYRRTDPVACDCAPTE
jgi:hypothetical protein